MLDLKHKSIRGAYKTASDTSYHFITTKMENEKKFRNSVSDRNSRTDFASCTYRFSYYIYQRISTKNVQESSADRSALHVATEQSSRAEERDKRSQGPNSWPITTAVRLSDHRKRSDKVKRIRWHWNGRLNAHTLTHIQAYTPSDGRWNSCAVAKLQFEWNR